MKLRLFLATVTFAVFLVVVWSSDPFGLFFLAFILLPWGGLPTALIGSLLWFIARTPRAKRVGRWLVGSVLAYALFMGLALPVNHLIQEHAVTTSKSYPARVAPLLEAYRQMHGAYPKSLDQLPSHPPMPRLMRRLGYHSDGQHYWFSFPQPGGFIDVWGYDSQTQRWYLDT